MLADLKLDSGTRLLVPSEAARHKYNLLWRKIASSVVLSEAKKKSRAGLRAQNWKAVSSYSLKKA